MRSQLLSIFRSHTLRSHEKLVLLLLVSLLAHRSAAQIHVFPLDLDKCIFLVAYKVSSCCIMLGVDYLMSLFSEKSITTRILCALIVIVDIYKKSTNYVVMHQVVST